MELATQYQLFCAAHPPQHVCVDGVEWSFIRAGQGPTLVLLPGGFGFADTSFRYMLAFEHAYDVVSVSYPPEITHIAALTDSLARFLAQIGVSRASVLGGSASGLVAQVLVHRHAPLVERLILSHTSLPMPRRVLPIALLLALFAVLPMSLIHVGMSTMNWAFLSGNTQHHRFWRAYFAQVIRHLPRQGYLTRLRLLNDMDATWADVSFQLSCPTLLINAAHDAFVGPAEQAELARRFPRAHRHVFAGGKHSDTITHPEAEIAVIQAFLNQTNTMERGNGTG